MRERAARRQAGRRGGRPVIRVGTRGSALALAQTQTIADSIAARTGEEIEIVRVVTEGDTSRASLASLGGTGV
ncbi:MAG: hydroxymethylbilane synthase, partial [Microbacteriaceae bacterium]